MSKELSGASIIGVTGTQYQDKNDPRFELSLQTTESWRDHGLPLVVVDGSPTENGSSDWVRAAHRKRGAIVLASEVNGIATQRQQGVRYALEAGAERFLTHEPEKVPMPNFASAVGGLLRNSDIVVVGRTERALDSLPPVQRRTERLAGWILERAFGLPVDALAGPRGYNIVGARHLLEYPAHKPGMNNWLYMYDTPLSAKAAGQNVTGIQVDLIHPRSMVEQETNNPVFDAKRFTQFHLQLDYLLRRSDVRPEALAFATTVLQGLNELSDEPSNEQYEVYFADLESRLTPKGYRPVA